MIYRPISHLIGEVVTAVRKSYSLDNILPYYEYGTELEVVNRLRKKSEHSLYAEQRYPLVWHLIKDSVHEEVDSRVALRRKVLDVTLIFCMQTSPDYSSEQRYANVFIPVLRPLYDLFMFHLKSSVLIQSLDMYKHNYYENLFWGSSGLYGVSGNVFDDRLDAIVIDGLELLVIEKC